MWMLPLYLHVNQKSDYDDDYEITKYCRKEEKLLLRRSNFSSFPQYFQYISNFSNQITYSFVKCDCSVYFFLNSANLICQGMDISMYFRDSLEIGDNKC